MSRNILNADKKAYIRHLANAGDIMMQAVVDGMDNRVVSQLFLATPTTPSSQITGAGATTWNINLDKGVIAVDGSLAEFAAQSNFSAGTASPLLAAGQSLVAAIVAWKNAAGTIAIASVLGTPATTATQVAPSDGTIQNSVNTLNAGALSTQWTRIGYCTINRTADTTVTQSQDNTGRDFGIAL